MIPLEQMTEEQFERHALDTVHRELGVYGLARFLRVYRAGADDYKHDRHRWLHGVTVQDLTRKIQGEDKWPLLSAASRKSGYGPNDKGVQNPGLAVRFKNELVPKGRLIARAVQISLGRKKSGCIDWVFGCSKALLETRLWFGCRRFCFGLESTQDFILGNFQPSLCSLRRDGTDPFGLCLPRTTSWATIGRACGTGSVSYFTVTNWMGTSFPRSKMAAAYLRRKANLDKCGRELSSLIRRGPL